MKWDLTDPTLEEVAELARRFPEVVELPEKMMKGEIEDWLAKGLVARNLGQRVMAEAAAHEFRLRAKLNGEFAAYNLEQGCLLFHFQEAGEQDSILNQPWVVSSQPLAVELW